MTNKRTRGGPLEGVRVLELTKVWAGPYAGKLLAYLGAEVIRVESLGSLDVTRVYGVGDINEAPGFQAVNPEKLSVQIDMKSAEGMALLTKLAATCDILVENLRPGAIARLGLGYEAIRAINPALVYVSMGMYGNDGPLASQTGYAPCFAALSGLTSLVGYPGEPPQGMNIRYADSTFGALAAFAGLAALAEREHTGEGQFVDVSAVESLSSVIGDTLIDFALNGHTAAAEGNSHPDMAPHGVYPCSGEDWISVAVVTEQAWRALCSAMHQDALAENPRFASLAARKHNEAELDAIIAQWTRGRDAGEAAAELQRQGVAAAKSANSIDLVSDDHLWQRGFFRHVTDGKGNTKATVGPAWQMTDPAEVSAGAPLLGEHNGYVFGEILGICEAEQARLAEAGVIR